jgi:hypothetical protein
MASFSAEIAGKLFTTKGGEKNFTTKDAEKVFTTKDTKGTKEDQQRRGPRGSQIGFWCKGRKRKANRISGSQLKKPLPRRTLRALRKTNSVGSQRFSDRLFSAEGGKKGEQNKRFAAEKVFTTKDTKVSRRALRKTLTLTRLVIGAARFRRREHERFRRGRAE